MFDLPAVLVPVLANAWTRREFWRALASVPSFFVLRTVNAGYMVEALVTEVLLRKPLLVYEKGH